MSQATKLPPLSEINRALAEGLEAKELLNKRSVSLHKADSVISGLQVSEKLCIDENKSLHNTNSVLEAQKGELGKLLDAERKESGKQRDRKVFWRGVGISTSLVAIVLVLLAIL